MVTELCASLTKSVSTSTWSTLERLHLGVGRDQSDILRSSQELLLLQPR